MNYLLFLLLAQPNQGGTEGGGGGGMSSMLIFLLLIIVVFYFFMIRPQQKKQKKIQQYRDALKKGDEVITIGGIHGKIVDVQTSTFIIEVEGGTKLKIEKAAVAIDNNPQKK